MTDAAAARRAFLEAQIANLAPLGFVVVGLPEPPYDALQVRLEEDASFVVEIAAREATSPFTEDQARSLARLAFTSEGDTWVAPPVPDAPSAVALVEAVLVEVLATASTTAIDVRHGTVREERAAVAKVAAMRRFIEPVLSTIADGPPEQDPDGDYVLDLHDMRVFVAPRALPGRPAIIRVFAITNAGLNLNAELGLFLARVNFSLAFGRFSIDTDNRAVWFDETLLGDQVTAEELTFVVEVVAQTASEWDDKIAALFGGTFRGNQPVPPAVTPAATKPGQGGYL